MERVGRLARADGAAARDRLLDESRGGGAGRAARRRARARRAARGLALDDPGGAGRPRAQRRRPPRAAAAGRHLRRRAQGRARPHQPRRAAGLPAPPGLPVRRAGAVDRDVEADAETRRGARAARAARSCSRSCACGSPTASRSRSSARCSPPSASRTCSTARWRARCTSCSRRTTALVPGEAEERIEVVAAGAAEARLLELRRGAPLLAVARTAWDADGRAFERSHDLFRADRARIVVRARAAPAAATLVGAAIHRPRGWNVPERADGRARDHPRAEPTHRRWDETLAPVLEVEPGDVVVVETDDFAGGQITRDSTVGRPAPARLRRDLPARGADRGPRRAAGRRAGGRDPRLRAARLGLGLHHPRASGCSRARSSRSRTCGLRPDRRATGRRSPPGVSIPIEPFCGTMGVPGAGMRGVPIPPPHAGGGNMDCRHLTAGTTLYLPVGVDGRAAVARRRARGPGRRRGGDLGARVRDAHPPAPRRRAGLHAPGAATSAARRVR